MQSQNIISLPQKSNPQWSQLISSLGAAGVAVQNYQAVDLFLLNVLKITGSASTGLNVATQCFAFITGGVCSGMVNYWMNYELLNDFEKRISNKTDTPYNNLNFWQKLEYISGVLVFTLTGMLFGLMAFTFAQTGPLAILSIVVGLLVSVIMTIQEVETWLSSYDSKTLDKPTTLTNSQLIGKWAGHLIDFGNVIALSLLFTLSLSQSLIFLGVGTNPALLIGFSIAFTFGAFTEFYFYNYYLSDFCKNISENFNKLKTIDNLGFGLMCIITNALVNTALTYSGIEILTLLLLSTATITPPTGLIMIGTILLSVFAGSASFILGADFLNKQNSVASHQEAEKALVHTNLDPNISRNRFTLFSSSNKKECLPEALFGNYQSCPSSVLVN